MFFLLIWRLHDVSADLSSAHWLLLLSPVCHLLSTSSPHSFLPFGTLAYIFQLLQLSRLDLWLFCSVRLLSSAWVPLPCAVAQSAPLGRKPRPNMGLTSSGIKVLCFPSVAWTQFPHLFLSSFIVFWWEQVWWQWPCHVWKWESITCSLISRLNANLNAFLYMNYVPIKHLYVAFSF